ncbi:hypothetical protein R1sor_008580 [Riccia sorocarpa]|uniref:Uncharacterized protein n=1 Tax=Riccia sorocarpa TaxID=122646 RepID=A0ABD3HVY9_9MARC
MADKDDDVIAKDAEGLHIFQPPWPLDEPPAWLLDADHDNDDDNDNDDNDNNDVPEEVAVAELNEAVMGSTGLEGGGKMVSYFKEILVPTLGQIKISLTA